MARQLQTLALLFSLLAIVACQPNGQYAESVLPESSGKYGEVLVVVDSSLENGPIGEQLEKIFYKALEATPQREASFRMSTVHPFAFKSILKRSRNLLKIDVDPKNKNQIKIDRNVWAKDQLLINVSAKSGQAALRMLIKNEQGIRDHFNEEELKRLSAQFSIQPNKDLIEEVKTNYGLSILIPPAFVMMENNENSFWIKKEKSIGEHQIIQGLLFYKRPYTSDSTFSVNYLMDGRDAYTSTMVRGFRDSSYMQVYREFTPISTELSLDDKYAVEYRGLWNMKNDFMGGPFIHYTLVDQDNQIVIDIDGFVYAPKFNKREYLRELEAIIKSMKLLN